MLLRLLLLLQGLQGPQGDAMLRSNLPLHCLCCLVRSLQQYEQDMAVIRKRHSALLICSSCARGCCCEADLPT